MEIYAEAHKPFFHSPLIPYGMKNRIRHWRLERDLTLEQLAEQVEPPSTFATIQRLEMGKVSLTQEWMERLAKPLGVEPVQLISDNVPGAAPLVPLVGYVGAGAEVFPVDDYTKGSGIDEVTCPIQMNPTKAIALEVIGDSMEPLIHEGFLLFYEKRVYGVPEEWLGKICVVKVVEGATYVKQVKKGSGVGLYNLHSINPKQTDKLDAQVEWCAKVDVWVQR